jgi:hypothetical protein
MSNTPILTITLRQAENLVAFFGGHDTEVSVGPGLDGTQSLMAWCTEYPEEGAVDLGPTEVDDELANIGRPIALNAPAGEPSDDRIAAVIVLARVLQDRDKLSTVDAIKAAENLYFAEADLRASVAGPFPAPAPQRDAPAGDPVAWVPRAKCDGGTFVEGEFIWSQVSECKYESADPAVWEACPLYAKPLTAEECPFLILGDKNKAECITNGHCGCGASPPLSAQPAAEPVMIAPILAEVERAVRKFPTWPTDPLHALAVLGEEFGELTKDVLQLTYEPHKSTTIKVRNECIQTAAMALRFFVSLDRYEYKQSAQHEQPAFSPQAQPSPEVKS